MREARAVRARAPSTRREPEAVRAGAGIAMLPTYQVAPLLRSGELIELLPDFSLDELGHHADPPMTKDAVAGRIRRLLAMADKRAEDEGIPGTEASLTSDMLDG